MDLERRRAQAVVLKPLAPGYGTCFRCDIPWKFIKGHPTPYGGGRACFPLCEMCWQELTIEERLPYYEKLLKWWNTMTRVEGGEAEAIIGAVVAGL